MNNNVKSSSIFKQSATDSASPASASVENTELQTLIQKIKSNDDKIRAGAVEESIKFIPSAVSPLIEIMNDNRDFEMARAAKRALWKIVRHTSRQNADKERKAVCLELIKGFNNSSIQTKRELLWMLSEIGNDDSIPAMSKFLSDKDLREDARCCIERIPTKKAISALQSAFKNADEEFKYALAESLRARGVRVDGYPSKKLIPARQTNIGKKP